MTLLNRNGQQTAEYAVLIAVVVGAVVAMQVYVKRSLQGKVKDVTDHVGDSLGTDKNPVLSQYEPYYSDSGYDVTQAQSVNEKYLAGGKVDRLAISQKTTREGDGFSNTGTDLTKDDKWTDTTN